MKIIGRKGNVVIVLIAAMLLVGVLGAGIYSLTSSSTNTGLLANNDNQAYHLAQAGVRYAIDLRKSTSSLASKTYLMPDNDHKFNIKIEGYVITAIGIVNEGSFMETRRQIIYTVPGFATANPDSAISSSSDSSSFGANTGGTNSSGAVTVNSDNTFSFGGGVTASYASLWYQGSSSANSCVDGVCNFNLGLNAYFDFTFSDEDYSAGSTTYADGFTFAVISAINNTRDRTGGAASQGELLGYAGPGTTTDGLGLKPPKMALEFDTFPNGSGDLCSAGSRNDPNAASTSNFRNHAALMFWGDKTVSGSNCSGYSRNSYDDNRHGSGSGDNPVNSNTGDNGYYQYSGTGRGYTCKSSANTCNWLEDGYAYSCRIEIVRPSAAPYTYQIRAWVMRKDLTGLTDLQTSRFQDVMVAYTDSSPQIIRSVTLAETDHNDFQKVFFGFTEATGANTQHLTVANFKTYFPKGDCSYSLAPATAAFTAAGGSGSTAITTTNACSWAAYPVPAAPNNWITIASGNESGTGSGSINYTVAANTGATRIGYISVTGQYLQVTQCSPLSISTASLPVGRINVAYTSTTISASGGASPYTWSQSGLPAGLTLNASTGVISGTPTATGLFTPVVTVNDSCTQTASQSYSMRIKYDTYTITNSTGATIYRRTGGTCQNANSISNGGTYSIAYNSAAVRFYKTRTGGNTCSGSNISITGANADSADTDFNGNVQINSSWSLVNN